MKKLMITFLLVHLTSFFSCERINQSSFGYSTIERLMSQQPDSALKLLRQTKDIEIFSTKEKAHYYLLLTEAEDKTKKMHTTDSLISIAADYYEETDDIERKAKAWYYKGRINQKLNHLLEAYRYYLKALQDEEQIKDHELLGKVNNHIGMLYADQSAYEKALLFQKKAIINFQTLKDSANQLLALRDLGRIYRMVGSGDSATICYQQAIALSPPKVVTSIYTELANLYLSEQKNSEAKELLEIALRSAKNSQDKYPVYLTLGELFRQCNHIDSAHFYLHACVEFAPLPATRAGALYHLKEIALTQKQWKQAARLSKQFEILSDSITKRQQTESIKKTQGLYSYSQIQPEWLEAQLYIPHQKLKYVLFLSALLLFLLGSILILLRSEKEKKILRRQLNKNEKRIFRNNQLIQNLKKAQTESTSQLEKLAFTRNKLESENRDLNEEKIKRQEGLEQLKKCHLYDKFYSPTCWSPTIENWNLLFSCIEEDYPTFSVALQKALPHLSTIEKRLCYLIKIRVKPSAISILIERDNVSMIRKRLYEKLTNMNGTAKDFDEYISRL